MKHPFEGGNAIFQSNISLLRRLMNAISPAPVNSDLYFHEMHKLDKGPRIQKLHTGERGTYDRNTITCLWRERLLNGGNLTSPDDWKLAFPSTSPLFCDADLTCTQALSRIPVCLRKYLSVFKFCVINIYLQNPPLIVAHLHAH